MMFSSFFRARKNQEASLPVAVMGGLRSGTNLISAVLEEYWNVEAGFHHYGWKHAGVPVLSPASDMSYPDIPIIWISKHPISFVASLHRYLLSSQTGRGISLRGASEIKDFIRTPIILRDSQLRGSPQFRFSNPLQYWNFITWNLENLDPARFNVLSFNYEDILQGPDILTRIEDALPVSRRKTGPIRLPEARMGRGKTRSKQGMKAFEPTADARGGQSYLFDPEDLDFIQREIDPWLASRRGYTLEVG